MGWGVLLAVFLCLMSMDYEKENERKSLSELEKEKIASDSK